MSENRRYTVKFGLDIVITVPNDLHSAITNVLTAKNHDLRLVAPYERLIHGLMADQSVWEKFLIHKAILNAGPYIDSDATRDAMMEVQGETTSSQTFAQLVQLDPADQDAILSAFEHDWIAAFDIVHHVLVNIQEPLRATLVQE